jgi:exopolyphosphatase / guanosine-5'-triphosphate,3'-diphosphate pyrophosphatase
MNPVAAIDLGTNSTRLLIDFGDAVGPGVTEPVRRMTVTGLGRGVDAGGSLHDEAINRTIDCLRTYQLLLVEHGVSIDDTHVRMIATSAARDAANRETFFDACQAAVGVRPTLLTGEEEGRLSFAGATAGLEPGRTPFGETALDLVVDIGGGSTEFVVGVAGTEPIGAISVDAGCVRFTEKFLTEFDPPGPEALSGAVTVMRAHLDDVDRDLPEAKSAKRMIGLAGSITTVAAVEIGLHTYDRDKIHHFVLTKAAAEDVFRTLATERRADRAFNPGLAPDRVDTIVAGAAILVTIMRHYEFDECLVSENDILDGVVASLRAEPTQS